MTVWSTHDFDEPGGLAAARRLLLSGLDRFRLPIALSGGLVVSLAVVAALPPSPPRRETAAPSVMSQVWSLRPDQRPLFVLDAPLLAGQPRRYAAWTRDRILAGADEPLSEREDRLTIGAPDAPGPFLHMAIRRSATGGRETLFVAAARRGADAGLAIGRFGAPDVFVTRFGEVESAWVDLDAKPARQCAVMRLEAPEAALDAVAFVCPAAGRALTPTDLACVWKRLDAPQAGPEPAVRRYLQAAPADLRDPACEPPAPAPTAPRARAVAATRQ